VGGEGGEIGGGTAETCGSSSTRKLASPTPVSVAQMYVLTDYL
jgi:hypothetical protein